jgi:hypothetical protein
VHIGRFLRFSNSSISGEKFVFLYKLIQLIADGKVWDIWATTLEKNFKGIRKTYHIRINKNTAKVLTFWVER